MMNNNEFIQPPVYCLTYNNVSRREKMKMKFKQLGIDVIMHEGVGSDDPRCKYTTPHDILPCMLGHLDMIHKFYNESDQEYGIMCEDDLCIHTDFASTLNSIITKSKLLDLDVVLIGYLLNYRIEYNGQYTHTIISELDHTTETTENNKYHFYTYHDELWGTQMYIISKRYAKQMIDVYNLDYAKKNSGIESYAADFIITKKATKRALIYPPLCIENGEVSHYEHHGQKMFHLEAHEKHISAYFI